MGVLTFTFNCNKKQGILKVTISRKREISSKRKVRIRRSRGLCKRISFFKKTSNKKRVDFVSIFDCISPIYD